jgi:hypothetical protein
MVLAEFTLPLWAFPLLIWTAIWKLVGLWHSGRNNQLVWFVFMGVLNTAGILPIIYLIFFQKKGNKKKK